MGLGVIDDADGGGGISLSSSKASCSICLEPVTDNGDRSWAKLQCGHEFHLDCIGSAFNIKGVMQCPNCRKIEKGQWLFATGCRSFTDTSFEDWPHDEDLYDLSYSEMSFGVQWCPITAFPQLPEEGDFPSTTYHDLLSQHAVFSEHTSVSSSTHPCPYVTYYGPIHSSSSNSLENVSDSFNFNTHWGAPSGSSEVPSSYTFGSVDPHYRNWEHHALSGYDQSSLSTSRAHSGIPRSSGSFVHPFLPSQRVGSLVTSSMIPPYPGSAARARDRAQALQAYFQPPSSSLPMRTPAMSAASRRSNGHHHGMSQANSMSPSSDQMNGGFYMFPPGTSNRNFPGPENQIPTWERDHHLDLGSSFPRDSGWGGFHQPAAGPPSGFRQRNHGSERTPSQNRS